MFVRDRKPSGPPGISYQLANINDTDTTLTESSVAAGLCASEREILAMNEKIGCEYYAMHVHGSLTYFNCGRVSKKTLANL